MECNQCSSSNHPASRGRNGIRMRFTFPPQSLGHRRRDCPRRCHGRKRCIWVLRGSAESWASWAELRQRRTPLARMAAILRRRSSGVRWAGLSGECRASWVSCCMRPQRPSPGDQRAVWLGSENFSLVFTYPVEVRNVGLGCSRNRCVNPERAVKRRFGEFESGF